MCLLILLYAYLVNAAKLLKVNNSLKNGVNVLVTNKEFYKKRLYEGRLCLLKNRINLFFWKKKYHERSIEEKLNPIPVYILTNYSNSPYIFHENDKQVCYMFLCPYDAENMLKEIIKSNSIKNVNNIKIHSINMQKAYELIKEFLNLKNLEKKNVDSKKNYVYWKLMPSKRQVQNALIYLSFKKKSELVFPIFYVDGFYIHRHAKAIVPLFFDVEDLKNAVEKVSMKNYKIKVINFVDLILSDNHKSFGFIPSSKSLEYLDKLNKIGIRKSYF
ncbi:apicoplast TIC22 protein, putative [Plasmodium malariae]|uniref:Apicoplast TIC22 protein, putative n=1 Tax=Plasmodium malariae TaxID=5858 RepID=A0A1C3KDC0_PLAMA|nr:apicoplast TIC22 protein, putative [Plasmodium malariae]